VTRTWPAINYDQWSSTCDTLHAHTQVLGKLAVALAPPEPQLQHGALRLSTRGWETLPLPAPDASGALSVALDLRAHEVVLEHSDGRRQNVALTPNRPVGEVTRQVLDAAAGLVGRIKIDPTPQEVPWTVPLDEDREHRTYDPDRVADYFAAATQAALVLAAFRAPYRGRSTPVNAWWGSFDLAVNFFSGRSADPPSTDFIMRNAMDAQEVALGWWPGDPNYSGRCEHRNDPSRQTPIAGVLGPCGVAPHQSPGKRPPMIALLGPSSPRSRSCWGHRGRPIGRCASRRGDRFPRERSPHLRSRGDRNRRRALVRLGPTGAIAYLCRRLVSSGRSRFSWLAIGGSLDLDFVAVERR
jgi:hypothetical protein